MIFARDLALEGPTAELWVGNSSPPSDIEIGYSNGYENFCRPVMKGQYWKVTTTSTGYIFWVAVK